MQLSSWTSAFLVVVLVVHIDVVTSRGGRGGGGRGGGRGGGGRGGFFGSRGSIGGGASTFSHGSGLGSIARSSSFKTAIAGAPAGHLTYKGGKSFIRTPGAVMMWSSRPYYWGPSYYQHRSGYEMCSMSLINSTDNSFNDVFFNNGTRPKMIVWGCRSYTEHCCGYECCPSDNGGNSITEDLIIGLIVLLVFVYILYNCIRKKRDSIVPSANNDDKLAEYPVNTSGSMYDQAPQQPSYPQPPSYPQQPDPPPPYPS
uniref:CX domain-containing protein n=1 Tax=Plectus sambesii TaxID=2011161 RepID=A0A914XFF8_9BILA